MSPYEEFKRLLTKEVKALCRHDNERLAFDIRPGVTFQDVEVFLGNRIYQAKNSKIEHNLKIGRLEEYCKHVARLLRGKTFHPWRADVYRRQDVLREIGFYLQGILFKALGESANEIIEKYRDKISDSADVALTDVALYQQLNKKLSAEIVRRLKPKKRGRPRKSEES